MNESPVQEADSRNMEKRFRALRKRDVINKQNDVSHDVIAVNVERPSGRDTQGKASGGIVSCRQHRR